MEIREGWIRKSKIKKEDFIEIGDLGKRVLTSKVGPTGPFDQLVKRMVKLLEKNGLDKDVCGLAWSHWTEKNFKKRAMRWIKNEHSWYNKTYCLRVYNGTSLNVGPCEYVGLKYGKLYVRAESDHGKKLLGKK